MTPETRSRYLRHTLMEGGLSSRFIGSPNTGSWIGVSSDLSAQQAQSVALPAHFVHDRVFVRPVTPTGDTLNLLADTGGGIFLTLLGEVWFGGRAWILDYPAGELLAISATSPDVGGVSGRVPIFFKSNYPLRFAVFEQ